MYNIQCNFLVYEHLAFSMGNKLGEFSHNRKQVIGPDLLLLFQWFNVQIKAVLTIANEWPKCQSSTKYSGTLVHKIE